MYIEGDIYGISDRIKDIDPVLSLSFIRDRGEYLISRGNHNVMYVKPGELDGRVLDKLRWGDLTRRRLEDFIYELERSEDEAEKRRARDLRNKVESMTLDNYDKIVGIPHFSCGSWERGA